MTSWTLWYDEGQARGQSLKDYEKENIQLDELCSWQDYEGFWQARLKLDASFSICDLTFPQFANLRMFRPGIGPTWEDPCNTNGGKWVVRIKESAGMTTLLLWQKLLQAAFTSDDALHDMHDVCGLVLQFRPKGDMISIWNRNAAMDESTISRVSAFYHSLLGLERSTIQYQVHKDSQMRNSQVGPGRRSSNAEGRRSVEQDTRKRHSVRRERQSIEDDGIPEELPESEPQAGWVMVDSHKHKKVISAENVEPPAPLPRPAAARNDRNDHRHTSQAADWSSSSWRSKGEDSKGMAEETWRKSKKAPAVPQQDLAVTNPWGKSKETVEAVQPPRASRSPAGQAWQTKGQPQSTAPRDPSLAAWQTPQKSKMAYNAVAGGGAKMDLPAPRPKSTPVVAPVVAPVPEVVPELPNSKEAAEKQRFNWAEDSDEELESKAELDVTDTDVTEGVSECETDAPVVSDKEEPQEQPCKEQSAEENIGSEDAVAAQQNKQEAAAAPQEEAKDPAAAAARRAEKNKKKKAKKKTKQHKNVEEEEWESLTPAAPANHIAMVKQIGVLVVMGLILVMLVIYIGKRRLPMTNDEDDDVEYTPDL